MAPINRISVIIPSYNPSEKLTEVVQSVISQGFSDIIVIDDGSSGESVSVFDRAAQIDGCTVLRHEANKGKGAALKTGMSYFMLNRPSGTGIVTIDDDGQHLAADVRNCAEFMQKSGIITLGARNLKNSGAPLKSRFGNWLTTLVFRLGVGVNISDTQTGLRAVPRGHIEAFLNVPGNRFEYETNMLITIKKLYLEIAEMPIQTVYINKNKNTHFRVLKDSAVICFQFLKFTISSMLSAFIDILCFYLLLILIGGGFNQSHWATVTISAFIARGISSVFNFLFNKNIVFGRKEENAGKMIFKYYMICIAVILLSSQLAAIVSMASFITKNIHITLIKLVIDTSLFISNYFIQKRWVYKK